MGNSSYKRCKEKRKGNSMITYFCDCGGKVTTEKEKPKKCDCGKVFGGGSSHLDYINMNKTWSRTTKVEFSTTTMDESIRKINNG